MPSTLSLYTIQAIIILDSDGKRIHVKYYNEALAKDSAKFEKQLYRKSKKVNEDIMFLDNYIVSYKNVLDVFVFVIGNSDENELLLESVTSILVGTFQRLLKQISKKNMVEHLDLVLLIVDELIDDGILLETNSSLLFETVNQLFKAQEQNIDLSNINEQTFTSAWAMAKEQIARSLLK